MATHYNILAWRIPLDRGPGSYSQWGHTRSYVTEHTQEWGLGRWRSSGGRPFREGGQQRFISWDDIWAEARPRSRKRQEYRREWGACQAELQPAQRPKLRTLVCVKTEVAGGLELGEGREWLEKGENSPLGHLSFKESKLKRLPWWPSG